MRDLVAFLRARLDEDEALGHLHWSPVVTVGEAEAGIDGRTGQPVYAAVQGHAWSPDRVLREVEAKRAILDDYVQEREALAKMKSQRWPDAEGLEYARIKIEVLEGVLGGIAAVWSDHPDYDEVQLGPPAPPHDGRPGGEQQHRDHGDENTQHDRPV